MNINEDWEVWKDKNCWNYDMSDETIKKVWMDGYNSNWLDKPVILQKGGQLNIKIYRDDNIEGFAAYCAQDDKDTKTILMNVYATLAASVDNQIDAKEFIIQNLMHEFGHALEEYYEKEFDENFIEKAVQTYFDKYKPV